MASDSNLNSIISQGIAVKQIYNPKKQNLEVQQHFNTQHTETKEAQDKTKIKQTENENRVENKEDGHKKEQRRRKKRKRKKSHLSKQSQDLTPEGNFIDIKV
jgi:hypothetical protein